MCEGVTWAAGCDGAKGMWGEGTRTLALLAVCAIFPLLFDVVLITVIAVTSCKSIQSSRAPETNEATHRRSGERERSRVSRRS